MSSIIWLVAANNWSASWFLHSHIFKGGALSDCLYGHGKFLYHYSKVFIWLSMCANFKSISNWGTDAEYSILLSGDRRTLSKRIMVSSANVIGTLLRLSSSVWSGVENDVTNLTKIIINWWRLQENHLIACFVTTMSISDSFDCVITYELDFI